MRWHCELEETVRSVSPPSAQAHDSSVRCMVWSHNDTWMVTGDHSGYVKYWQSNMNNVKMFQGHKEAIRGIRWERPGTSSPFSLSPLSAQSTPFPLENTDGPC